MVKHTRIPSHDGVFSAHYLVSDWFTNFVALPPFDIDAHVLVCFMFDGVSVGNN